MQIDRFKKIFLIIIFILITTVLGSAIYFLFFASSEEPSSQEDNPTNVGSGGFPQTNPGQGQVGSNQDYLPIDGIEPPKTKPSETAQGGLTATEIVNQNPSQGLTMSGNELRFYDRTENLFYRLDENGEPELLSDKKFYFVEKINWSGDGEKAILEYPDGSNIVYDFEKEEQITLPKHWEDFNFSPQTDEISAKSMGLDPNNRWLIVSNYDGTGVQAIERMGDNAEDVYPNPSPNNQIVAMYTRGVDFDRQEVFFVGRNDENFKSTVVHGRGFQPIWSPDGEKLIYSVYSSDNDMKPTLWVVDASGDNIGENRRMLNLDTWAEKCSFANDSELYCAVPRSLEPNSGPFPQIADETENLLYKVNIDTGRFQLVAVPEQVYNISEIKITSDQSKLYFTDKNSGLIYKINL